VRSPEGGVRCKYTTPTPAARVMEYMSVQLYIQINTCLRWNMSRQATECADRLAGNEAHHREGEIPEETPLDRLYSSQINSSFKSPAAHARLPVSVAMEPEDRSRRIIKKQSAMPAYISLSRARSIGSRSNRNPLFRAVLQ
jgi:hypothetical protein